MKKFRFGILIAIIVLLTGCINIPIGDGKSISPSKDGITIKDSDGKETKVNIDKDEGSVAVSGGDGEEFNFGANADIPEQFPSDIPIPEDAIVVSGVTLNDESKNTTAVNYVYVGEFDEIVKLYKDYFTNGEFDSVQDSDSDEDIATVTDMFAQGGRKLDMINASKGNEDYMIQIRGDEEEGNVTVNIIYSIPLASHK